MKTNHHHMPHSPLKAPARRNPPPRDAAHLHDDAHTRQEPPPSWLQRSPPCQPCTVQPRGWRRPPRRRSRLERPEVGSLLREVVGGGVLHDRRRLVLPLLLLQTLLLEVHGGGVLHERGGLVLALLLRSFLLQVAGGGILHEGGRLVLALLGGGLALPGEVVRGGALHQSRRLVLLRRL
eukprot:2105392-Prymnesium_polylepis.1